RPGGIRAGRGRGEAAAAEVCMLAPRRLVTPGEAPLAAGGGIPGGRLLPLELGREPPARPAGVGVGLVPAHVLHRLVEGDRLEVAEAVAAPGAVLAAAPELRVLERAL